MKSDMDIAKLEKEIAKKYGKEAIVNPRSLWNEEKEKRYLEATRLRKQDSVYDDKTEMYGFEVSSRLLDRDSNKVCPTCNKYNLNIKDDVKMTEFGCCFSCYVQYIEGREERWKSGWRPNKQNFPKD